MQYLGGAGYDSRETLSARNGDASRAAAVFSVNRVEPRFANASFVSGTSRVSVSEDVASSSKRVPEARKRARADTRRFADVDEPRHASYGSSSSAPSAGEPPPDGRLSTAPIAAGDHGTAEISRRKRARPFCAAGQAPPRRGLADGRQRLGRIRIGAASANGRGDGSAGRDGRTGSRATRCRPKLVVPETDRDSVMHKALNGPCHDRRGRLGHSLITHHPPPRRHSFARVAASSGGR